MTDSEPPPRMKWVHPLSQPLWCGLLALGPEPPDPLGPHEQHLLANTLWSVRAFDRMRATRALSRLESLLAAGIARGDRFVLRDTCFEQYAVRPDEHHLGPRLAERASRQRAPQWAAPLAEAMQALATKVGLRFSSRELSATGEALAGVSYRRHRTWPVWVGLDLTPYHWRVGVEVSLPSDRLHLRLTPNPGLRRSSLLKLRGHQPVSGGSAALAQRFSVQSGARATVLPEVERALLALPRDVVRCDIDRGKLTTAVSSLDAFERVGTELYESTLALAETITGATAGP